MKERRYDIDWVRVVATLAVFVFHSGRFFDKLDWHLKNAQQSYFLTMFVGLLDLWMMPLGNGGVKMRRVAGEKCDTWL